MQCNSDLSKQAQVAALSNKTCKTNHLHQLSLTTQMSLLLILLHIIVLHIIKSGSLLFEEICTDDQGHSGCNDSVSGSFEF